MRRTMKFSELAIVLLILLAALSGCGEFGYYLQCARGQLDLMQRARPIKQLLADPELTPAMRTRLEKVEQIRDFAVSNLALPDNDSYRSYADIERPFVVWNIVATEEFSLRPKQWCFPVAGCVSYRGYFQEQEAQAMAARLRRDHLDVDLYGVQAYSTLNWFADPVLSTFINSSEGRLAGLIFHELAHQVVYIKGDSAFNEAFAQTVQREGVRRWLQSQATPEAWQAYQRGRQQNRMFHSFLKQTREELQELYKQPLAEADMRERKQMILQQAEKRFQDLKQAGEIDGRYDRWMARGLNNARFAAIATYYDLLPDFQNLLQQANGDLARFYALVRALADLPQPERLARLQARQAADAEQAARSRPIQSEAMLSSEDSPVR